MTSLLRIGTRGSPLALWQANFVADQIRAVPNTPVVQLITIQTSGDQVRDVPLSQIGGDGLFTKEIQRALLEGQVDLAVHSLKDLPTTYVAGLILAAVPMRGPIGDVLVAAGNIPFAQLPPRAKVATGSLRRQSQLLHRRPDLVLVPMRGNVETRLRKLTEENLDGLVLAQAGLERLGLAKLITEILDPEWMLPAVGQGALGLECREQDLQSIRVVEILDDRPTHQRVLAERSLLRALGGGCQVPIGAWTSIAGNLLTLRAAVIHPAGSERIEATQVGESDHPEELGESVAGELFTKGAGKLLACLRER